MIGLAVGSRALASHRARVTAVLLSALLTLAACTSSGSAAGADSKGGVPALTSTTPTGGEKTGGDKTGGAKTGGTSASAPTTATSSASASTTKSVTPSSTKAPTPPKVTSTVTSTVSGVTLTAGPPKATKEPAAVDGDCPYLSADLVSDITGQHHGQTQLVALQPQPMCIFYRSDGGLMGSIRVIMASDPQSAVAAVNQHVPVAGSQPASQPAGWTGGSMTTDGQMTQDSTAKSVYAVSKGNVAVVAEENESPSLKARVMAVCAIYSLKLEPGTAPDYCTVSTG